MVLVTGSKVPFVQGVRMSERHMQFSTSAKSPIHSPTMECEPHGRKVRLSNTCLSQSLGGDRSVSLMTVKAFTEHVLAGNLRPAGKLLAH